MKNLTYLFFGVMIALFIQACGNERGEINNRARFDTTGTSFIKNGIKSGNAELKASGLVITISNNQRVIGFAKMLLDDHTNASDTLQNIAANKQILLTDTTDASHDHMIAALSKKSGRVFDKAYMQMMVADHVQAVKLFTDAMQNPDTDIKNFAAKTLPTIKMHLDSANAILISLK